MLQSSVDLPLRVWAKSLQLGYVTHNIHAFSSCFKALWCLHKYHSLLYPMPWIVLSHKFGRGGKKNLEQAGGIQSLKINRLLNCRRLWITFPNLKTDVIYVMGGGKMQHMFALDGWLGRVGFRREELYFFSSQSCCMKSILSLSWVKFHTLLHDSVCLSSRCYLNKLLQSIFPALFKPNLTAAWMCSSVQPTPSTKRCPLQKAEDYVCSLSCTPFLKHKAHYTK